MVPSIHQIHIYNVAPPHWLPRRCHAPSAVYMAQYREILGSGSPHLRSGPTPARSVMAVVPLLAGHRASGPGTRKPELGLQPRPGVQERIVVRVPGIESPGRD